MFDANNISARSDVRCIRLSCLHAGWLQNYFNTIQTPSTFENRNVTRYDLRIFTRKFRPEIGRKIRLFSLGRKNNILIKKESSSQRFHIQTRPLGHSACVITFSWFETGPSQFEENKHHDFFFFHPASPPHDSILFVFLRNNRNSRYFHCWRLKLRWNKRTGDLPKNLFT